MSEDFSTQESIQRTGARTSGYTIISTFKEVKPAEEALNNLRKAGFTKDDVSVVTRDRSAQKELNEATDKKIDSGDAALVGSLGGGTIGAALGWLITGGALAIPGVGPILAGGTLAGLLGGALIGGSIGGIAGALIGAGIPENEAKEYEGYVKGGQTVITINTPDSDRLQTAAEILGRAGATNVRYFDLNQPAGSAGTPYNTGTTPRDTDTSYNTGTTPRDNDTSYNTGTTPRGIDTPYNTGANPRDTDTSYNPGSTPRGTDTPYNTGANPRDTDTSYNPGSTPRNNDTPYNTGAVSSDTDTPYKTGANPSSSNTPYDPGNNPSSTYDTPYTTKTDWPDDDSSSNSGRSKLKDI